MDGDLNVSEIGLNKPVNDESSDSGTAMSAPSEENEFQVIDENQATGSGICSRIILLCR